MQKIEKILGMMLGLVVLIITIVSVSADTGHEGATRVERGTSSLPFKVSGSSITGTSFLSAKTTRADAACRVNGNYTIWVGSASDTAQLNHPNVVNGFPVNSSETFKLDGQNTGVWYFTCDPSVSACEFRCIEGIGR